MTGSLSILGEVLPIGGISAKIEGAVETGIKTVIVPKSNIQDIVISEANKKKIKIIPAEYFGEVLEHVLDWKKTDAKTKAMVKKIFQIIFYFHFLYIMIFFF